MAIIRQQISGGFAGPASVAGYGTLISSAMGFPLATLAGSLIICVTFITIGTGGNPPSPAGGLPTIAGSYAGVFNNTSNASAAWTKVGVGGGNAQFFYIADAPVMSPSNMITTNVLNSYGFGNTMACEFVLYEVTDITHPEVYDLSTGKSRNNRTGGTPVTSAFTATPNIDFIIGTLIASGTNIAAGSGFTLGLGAQHATVGQTEYWLAAPVGQTHVGFTGSESYWGIGAMAFATSAPVVTISVSPSSASIPIGGTQQFIATVSSGGATWSSDDGTISGTGLYTPATLGTHHVTATSTDDPTKSATVPINVISTPAIAQVQCNQSDGKTWQAIEIVGSSFVSGGLTVTIDGTTLQEGFVNGETIPVGGTLTPMVRVVSSTLIYAWIPPSQPVAVVTAVDIVVTNLDGGTVTSHGASKPPAGVLYLPS